MSTARSRLIVALDVPDRQSALKAARSLMGHVGLLKVGLQLFVAEGPRIVQEIREMGHMVFLDLKLHDIPNTVAGAVRSAGRLGVQMLTLHVSGGRKMLETARAASNETDSPPLLVGVTALTSLSLEDCEEIGVAGTPAQWTARLAEIATRSGIGGLVCSPAELPALRNQHVGLKLIVPGIRPAGQDAHDQSRTSTPGEAVRRGADYIVVGRPIMQAPDPALAAEQILAELSPQ
jgi:orotidine-5'-phosphate decarboxylase